MKLSDLQNPGVYELVIWRWLVLAFGIAVSLVIAYWIGTEQTLRLEISIAVAVVAFVTAGLRNRAWLLIPATWLLTGSTGSIPFGLSLHDVGILLAFCAYVGYHVLTHRESHRKLHPLDWLLTLNIVWIALTFIRHPVGLRVFGSETIGARPYINIALALIAYRVILRLPDSYKGVSHAPYFILGGSILIAILNLVVYVRPSLTPLMYQFYSGVDATGYPSSPTRGGDFTRWENLSPFGLTIVLVLCAAYPPRTLFNPTRWRFYFLVLGFAAVFAAGYRNIMLWAMVALVSGSWLHRGWREVVLAGIVAFLGLSVLLIGQGRLYQLPLQAQRTLCFLPGKWSAVVEATAEESTESRFKWWQRIIQEQLIKDWWLGDGIGVSERDYNLSINEGMATSVFDWYTVTGYHNGPLSAVRFAGIIGMILFYALMIFSAVYSVQCVDRCRGTPLFMVAVYIAIQLLWYPVHFTFVFGSYADQAGPQHIFLVAILLLLWHMSEQPLPSASPSSATARFPSSLGAQTPVLT